ncbi:hypothetical protein ACVIM8_006588 [Bradyrhizobium sp. USDA 4529]
MPEFPRTPLRLRGRDDQSSLCEGRDEGESPRGRRELVSRRLPLTRNLRFAKIPASPRKRGEASTSFLFLALADQVFREIGQRRARQGVEGKRAGDIDRGEAEPGGQQAVEHAFAEAL